MQHFDTYQVLNQMGNKTSYDTHYNLYPEINWNI